MSLWPRLKPCGPVVSTVATGRALEGLRAAAERDGWSEVLDGAWSALAPAFAASPYLAGLARRQPKDLRDILAEDPDTRLAAILAETAAAGTLALPEAATALRRAKAQLHLLTALCDLGGVWDLDQVTGALTRFADAGLSTALASAVRAEIEAGRLSLTPPAVLPGYFYVAMGKHGAQELNYSSDIDYSIFYEPALLPLAEGVEPHAFAIRLSQTVAQTMQARTADGYVFRVDLRLRPDPSSTPIAVTVDAAVDYYQTVGQNWERAAFIKARVCAGDLEAGRAFLADMQPFIWRRNLDFAAIEDLHSIKRQIHVHKVDDSLDPRGADLKLGRGGIREVEFFVQTQQLILGGRDPLLRSIRTVDALAALAAAGHISAETAEVLTAGYKTLRSLEHRAQMIADQQTHKLPKDDTERTAIAALAGYKSLRTFDADVGKLLIRVNRRYGELFAEDEDLSSRFGSLVFTGVEDDPETLATLKRMGFAHPPQVAETIRSWHHVRINATRSARGRELFTRLAPRVLDAAQASGAPDAAFTRFSVFFAGLSAGVQVQSLFLAQPKLLQLVVDVLAYAPNLASTLAKRPDALDSLLDRLFFGPLDPVEIEAAVLAACGRADGFEAVMDAARRAYREQSFRIGVQLIGGAAHAAEAGPAFTAVADGCLKALAPASLAETFRVGGAFDGDVAVLALGKLGSGEMTATSDLDLIIVYGGHAEGAVSAGKGWWAETFWGRFTQRLVASLSSPTAEGGLYEIDLKLRPFGADGAVAVSTTAFADYYAKDAETWELLALTRARVAWASREVFGDEVCALVEAALRAPRDRVQAAADTRAMRRLMDEERPSKGLWDLKLSPGGLVDIEFATQFLQIVSAEQGGPLVQHTGAALAACAGLADAGALATLQAAWTLQQDLSQVLKVALPDSTDPTGEPAGFRALLARAGGVRDFRTLTARIKAARIGARKAFEAVVV
jgi:glutamate-ammonia-ligase adenylyltransferase